MSKETEKARQAGQVQVIEFIIVITIVSYFLGWHW